ncbi:MAG: hypothetical protein DHS20C16_06870 [Phycisphaerae bacterium]|nr:MAG: hypothetical protein DHS20C16_06870 [Phycisphaerae bacterium]
MISHAPQMTLQDSTEKLITPTIGRWCLYALLSIVVLGGWLATWIIILGFGLTLSLTVPIGLIALSVIPAKARRTDAKVYAPARIDFERHQIRTIAMAGRVS